MQTAEITQSQSHPPWCVAGKMCNGEDHHSDLVYLIADEQEALSSPGTGDLVACLVRKDDGTLRIDFTDIGENRPGLEDLASVDAGTALRWAEKIIELARTAAGSS